VQRAAKENIQGIASEMTNAAIDVVSVYSIHLRLSIRTSIKHKLQGTESLNCDVRLLTMCAP